ncbi:uncharacterized protein LOC119298944 [Triticum dicoccoides]|uniref:uncharacterized protein LOC119298944 n=1 Tax=Triticum dicoccoides TaxID=85692 RepID=UPI00188F3D0B|nr:uncharacterized protein LOC119298944 [Triticum dicoccoides]
MASESSLQDHHRRHGQPPSRTFAAVPGSFLLLKEMPSPRASARQGPPSEVPHRRTYPSPAGTAKPGSTAGNRHFPLSEPFRRPPPPRRSYCRVVPPSLTLVCIASAPSTASSISFERANTSPALTSPGPGLPSIWSRLDLEWPIDLQIHRTRPHRCWPSNRPPSFPAGPKPMVRPPHRSPSIFFCCWANRFGPRCLFFPAENFF